MPASVSERTNLPVCFLIRRSPMDTAVVATYCLTSGDLLQAVGHAECSRRRVSDAEVITTALVAVRLFSGNFVSARAFLESHGYIPRMLSKSQFNRRLHRAAPLLSSAAQSALRSAGRGAQEAGRGGHLSHLWQLPDSGLLATFESPGVVSTRERLKRPSGATLPANGASSLA